MTSYSTPAITDHGSLIDLTADFDLGFVGSVAKVVSLAAVSPTVGGVIPGDGTTTTPGGIAGVLDSVGILSSGEPSGASEVLDDGPTVGSDLGSGPTDGAGPPADEGAVAGVGSEGGGEGGGPGSLQGEGGLPFTGYYATLFAAAGATLTTAGVMLRSKLRRKS